MQGIPLKPLPNQEFSVQLDGGLFNIILKSTGDTISVSIALNGVQMVWNARAVANQYVIPSAYQEAGNFMFVTSNFELPRYDQFGVTQSLIYVTGAELGVIRAPVTPPIVASDFSPYGALPLRFKPERYVPIYSLSASVYSETYVSASLGESLSASVYSETYVEAPLEFAWPEMIESIQTGEITIAAGASSNTATISAVNTANAVCFFGGWRSADTSLNTTEDYTRISLTNGTTVTAQTNSVNAGESRIARYTVVEFKSYIVDSIQQGTITISGSNTSATATITSVDTTRAFVIHQGQNHSTNNADFVYNQGRLDLTNATTVTATKGNGNNPSLVVGYAVVEFNPGVVVGVQKGTVNIAGLTNVGDATISAVDDESTLLINNGWNVATFVATAGDRMPMIYRTSITNIRAERVNSATLGSVQYNFTVVEFNAQWVTSRQAAQTQIAGSAASANATISSVDTSKSLLSWLGGKSSSTATSAPSDDYGTAKLNTSTQTTVERGGSPATTLTESWEVMEFV